MLLSFLKLRIITKGEKSTWHVDLTDLSLNPGLVAFVLIPISLRRSQPSRMDAADTDYFDEYETNLHFAVCPCLEDETEHGITKNLFLIGTPNHLSRVPFYELESLYIDFGVLDGACDNIV